MRDAEVLFERRAMSTRTGRGGLNQSLNMSAQRDQSTLNYDNSFINENFDRVSISNVQQINDMAYYFKGNRWVDSRLVGQEANIRHELAKEVDEAVVLADRPLEIRLVGVAQGAPLLANRFLIDPSLAGVLEQNRSGRGDLRLSA